LSFRRVRIPRVHAVQRLSISSARFKHMRDAAAQNQAIGADTDSIHRKSDCGRSVDRIPPRPSRRRCR
jgi:hypothetical protein